MAFPDKSGLSEEGRALVDLIKSAQKVKRDTSSTPSNISDNEMADEIRRKTKNMLFRLNEALAYAMQQGYRYKKVVTGNRVTVNLWHISEGEEAEGEGGPVATAPDVGNSEEPVVAEVKRGPGRPRKLTPQDVNAPTVPGLHVAGEELT